MGPTSVTEDGTVSKARALIDAKPTFDNAYLLEYYTSHDVFGFSNAKTVKGEKYGYSTAIIYLTPWTFSGVGNLCSSASEQCPESCINWTGRGETYPAVQRARRKKTDCWFLCRDAFLDKLWRETCKHVHDCAQHDLIPCVRLNGTSDILWEHDLPDLMRAFPRAVWYDDTKHEKRWCKDRPSNYHLTFSRSEKPRSEHVAREILKAGGNVAVVFADKHYPSEYVGFPTSNGDLNDLTFLHPPGHGISLYAKGPAKKENHGFVVRDYERVIRVTE